jgi:hypothetical protein
MGSLSTSSQKHRAFISTLGGLSFPSFHPFFHCNTENTVTFIMCPDRTNSINTVYDPRRLNEDELRASPRIFERKGTRGRSIFGQDLIELYLFMLENPVFLRSELSAQSEDVSLHHLSIDPSHGQQPSFLRLVDIPTFLLTLPIFSFLGSLTTDKLFFTRLQRLLSCLVMKQWSGCS